MAIKSKKVGPRLFKEFILPSGGYKYGGKIPGGKIKIHSFNFDVEQILAGEGDGLLKMSQVTPLIADLPEGLTVGDLLSADQYYMVLASRAMSFGDEYGFSTTCTACGKKERHMFILPDGMPVVRFKEDFKEPFVFELPNCKDSVAIRFLTVNDDLSINQYAKQREANISDPGDPGYKFRLAKHIVSVNGTVPDNIDDAINYVSSLDGKDPLVFRSTIEENQPGVVSLLTIICPKDDCREKYEVPFRMTSEFFRPKC